MVREEPSGWLHVDDRGTVVGFPTVLALPFTGIVDCGMKFVVKVIVKELSLIRIEFALVK